jgi:hypothetical protein
MIQSHCQNFLYKNAERMGGSLGLKENTKPEGKGFTEKRSTWGTGCVCRTRCPVWLEMQKDTTVLWQVRGRSRYCLRRHPKYFLRNKKSKQTQRAKSNGYRSQSIREASAGTTTQTRQVCCWLDANNKTKRLTETMPCLSVCD